MDASDVWIIIGLSFIAGGFFGAALQLWWVGRDLERMRRRLFHDRPA